MIWSTSLASGVASTVVTVGAALDSVAPRGLDSSASMSWGRNSSTRLGAFEVVEEPEPASDEEDGEDDEVADDEEEELPD